MYRLFGTGRIITGGVNKVKVGFLKPTFNSEILMQLVEVKQSMDNPFDEVMKQAQLVKEQMLKVQEELANVAVVGEAGAGMVKMTMNGRHDVINVEIDPELLKEPVNVVQDLIKAATNDAVQKVEAHNQDKVAGLASGFSQMPIDLNKIFPG